MADSTNPDDVRGLAVELVAGYVNGIYAWPEAAWATFAPGSVVGIAVAAATNAGHVLDVETGDATPAQAVDWVLMRRAAGIDPTVYVNASTWPQVEGAFRARGVAEPHYWVAAWNNRNEPIVGAVAHQYANPALSGGHYDLSWVADFWPGVDAPVLHGPVVSAPPPAPPPPQPTPPVPVPAPNPTPAPPIPSTPSPPEVKPVPPDPPVPVVVPPDVPEPPVIAEQGVTTSEWKLVIGYAAQAAAVGTADLVNVVSKAVFHTGVTIAPDQLNLIVGLEFALAIPVVGYAISRGIRKLGAN